jgi:uncharacterized protein
MHSLLIYVHGFNSSSKSQKAEEVRQYLETNNQPIDFLAPTFADTPGESFQQLLNVIEHERENNRQDIALIGSSLGGFMATAAAERMGLRAVLINPAVRPQTLIKQFLGENTNPYTGNRYTLHEGHMAELRSIEPKPLGSPEHLLVMLQTGDETLDYRDAQCYYKDCPQIVEEGGDHRFQHFDRHLPKLLEFLELVEIQKH